MTKRRSQITVQDLLGRKPPKRKQAAHRLRRNSLAPMALALFFACAVLVTVGALVIASQGLAIR